MLAVVRTLSLSISGLVDKGAVPTDEKVIVINSDLEPVDCHTPLHTPLVCHVCMLSGEALTLDNGQSLVDNTTRYLQVNTTTWTIKCW